MALIVFEGKIRLEVEKLFVKVYHSPEQDSNLGINYLSLLEFETWGIRPLNHQGHFS